MGDDDRVKTNSGNAGRNLPRRVVASLRPPGLPSPTINGRPASSSDVVLASRIKHDARSDEQNLPALHAVLQMLGSRAFGPGEYVGQQSFISVSDVTALLGSSGLEAESEVLDLCCGAGSVGLLVARSTGCRVVGVDRSPASVQLARQSVATMPGVRAEYIVGDAECASVAGPFDGVMLVETFLAIRRKRSLVQNIFRLLRPAGCLIATVEAGEPLSAEERHHMPASETVQLLPEASLRPLLVQSGFRIRSLIDLTEAHAQVAAGFAGVIEQEADTVAGALGESGWRKMLLEHQRWAEWLASGRVRKLGFVAERPAGS